MPHSNAIKPQTQNFLLAGELISAVVKKTEHKIGSITNYNIGQLMKAEDD